MVDIYNQPHLDQQRSLDLTVAARDVFTGCLNEKLAEKSKSLRDIEERALTAYTSGLEPLGDGAETFTWMSE